MKSLLISLLLLLVGCSANVETPTIAELLSQYNFAPTSPSGNAIESLTFVQEPSDVSPQLKQAAKCMLKVLAACRTNE